jgi:hypothetical protein
MKINNLLQKRNWLLHTTLQFLTIALIGLYVQLKPGYVDTINALWQFLPLDQIEKYGFLSIYYLHQQPPLLTTLLVFLIKGFGISNIEKSITVLMLIMLFANLCVMNRIVEVLQLKRIYLWIFVIFPSFWIYHTWFYESIFTFFFTNLVFLGLVSKPSSSSFLTFIIGMVGLTLSHGTFHPLPVLFIITLGWALIFRSIDIKKVRTIAVILLAIPIILIFKNFTLVGTPTLSSWAGCNLHQKFMHIGTGFDYVPKENKNIPEIIGSVNFNESGKLNTNNIDFAAHCNDNLKMIVQKISDPNEIVDYYFRVKETVINNESSLSIEYRGAGFSPSHWGKLNEFIVWLISLKPIYNFPLFLISIFCPLLALFACLKTRLFKPITILVLLYYFALSLGHLANGWEQMRMAYRTSFFLYICFFLCTQRALGFVGLYPFLHNFNQKSAN